jgi:hypothetical protein
MATLPVQPDPQSGFKRREKDHHFESICLKCFRTVGIEEEELSLRAAEETHVCGVEDESPTKWRSERPFQYP